MLLGSSVPAMPEYAPEGGKLELATKLFETCRYRIRCPRCAGNRSKPGYIRGTAGSTVDGLPRRYWDCQYSNGRGAKRKCKSVPCSEFIELAKEQLPPSVFEGVAQAVLRTVPLAFREQIAAYSETDAALSSQTIPESVVGTNTSAAAVPASSTISLFTVSTFSTPSNIPASSTSSMLPAAISSTSTLQPVPSLTYSSRAASSPIPPPPPSSPPGLPVAKPILSTALDSAVPVLRTNNPFVNPRKRKAEEDLPAPSKGRRYQGGEQKRETTRIQAALAHYEGLLDIAKTWQQQYDLLRAYESSSPPQSPLVLFPPTLPSPHLGPRAEVDLPVRTPNLPSTIPCTDEEDTVTSPVAKPVPESVKEQLAALLAEAFEKTSLTEAGKQERAAIRKRAQGEGLSSLFNKHLASKRSKIETPSSTIYQGQFNKPPSFQRRKKRQKPSQPTARKHPTIEEFYSSTPPAQL